MSRIPIVTVDAFADRAFSGNPAGVCVLDQPLDGGIMQRIAAEVNLSETAFLDRAGDRWNIRWFSPAVEVPLCGHATLASAHLLWESGLVKPDARIGFDSMSGPLGAWREGDRIGLDFPAAAPAPAAEDPGLAQALHARIIASWTNGAARIAELESDEVVTNLAPDLSALGRLEPMVFAVTARGTGDVDYVCRLFGPRVGVNEDPVTGSIQCALGPIWAARLGKTELQVRQRSARGGAMVVRIEGNRVHILGRAVTVLTGTLNLPVG